MLQLNKTKERWIREQAIDQGAIDWAMDVTSGEIEGAMDQGVSDISGSMRTSDGSGSNRVSDNYVLFIFISENDTILK